MCIRMCMLSPFSRVWLRVMLWTVALQAPLSMGFSRQEYWSGLPCHPPGDRPDPGIEPVSPLTPALQVDSLTPEPLGKSHICVHTHTHKVWCPKALLRPRNTLNLVSREYKKDFCSCLRILVIFSWRNLRSSFKEYWSQTEFDSLKPWKLSSSPPGKLFKIRSSTLPSAVCSKTISLSLFSGDYLLRMERPWEEEWNSAVDWEVTVFKQTK